MLETQILSLDQEDPLKKEMATHSSILPGKSHGQNEPDGLLQVKFSFSHTRESITMPNCRGTS